MMFFHSFSSGLVGTNPKSLQTGSGTFGYAEPVAHFFMIKEIKMAWIVHI
jgi:hypothetical protein